VVANSHRGLRWSSQLLFWPAILDLLVWQAVVVVWW
jgi:hypothetical protein